MTKPTINWLQLLCLGAFLLIGENLANAKTTQEIARKASGSTLLLVMEDANGQTLSLGSGFFVRDGEIASNLHVVKNAARGYAKLVGHQSKYEIEGIIAADSERDLVVLKISAAASSILPLGNSDIVQTGESVYAVGNPQGLEGTFSQGIVSSIRKAGTDKILQITAPISPGSSGGPVLNSAGEVIGVSVATFKDGQNLNFAIPVNYLKALFKKAGPVKPLTQTKYAKGQASIFTDFGDRSTEGVTGSQLTWKTLYDNSLVMRYGGSYSFSLRNHLRENVRNVHCLVIFYDKQGAPIEVDVVNTEIWQKVGILPAGLARRVKSQVDGSVQVLTTHERAVRPHTKVEFRILDFEIAK